MARKYSSISVETTLAAGINTTQTTMTVPNDNAATALLGGQTLAAGNVDIFTVVIDPDTANEEIVFVTNVSGSTLTISRGQAGTGQPDQSGPSHSAGATIRHVLTSSDLDFFRNGVATADGAIAKSIVNAKGDLIVATADDTPARLAVGSTNGQALTVDSSTASGLAWATISSAPKIGQVVQFYGSISTQSTSDTFVDVTNFNASITPTSATSKVLVLVSFRMASQGALNTVSASYAALLRGSTIISEFGTNLVFSSTLSNIVTDSKNLSFAYLDSPATTSSTTYKIQVRKNSSSLDVQTAGPASLILMEVLV